ncbi:glycosyltransferase family 2 protein [Ekhidna sp. To15]|uniref:glycosyltransferase family 2 protein n=1 Tax=Ekhidna sp. To15 TaxID=3395267 RepID=UPI003F51F723
MKVSVVIPVFNALKYIGEAIESINAQTAGVEEIICVDDCSTDDSVNYLIKYFPNVRVVKNSTNMGPSHARNLGIKAAAGELISFLDADDKWPKDKIRWQIDELMNDESLMLVGGKTILFSEDNSTQSGSFEEHFNVYLGSLLIKKAVFKNIGLFNENLKLSEDQDWFLRLREAGVPHKIVDRVALEKRSHNTNITKDLKFVDSGFITALKHSLDRRRLSGELSNLDKIQIQNTSDDK